MRMSARRGALECLLVLALLLPAAVLGGGDGLDPVAERPRAPAFSLPDVEGRTISLEDFRGRPVILNFWATWCPPCRAEMPALDRAATALAEVRGAVIGISVGDDAESVRRFLDQVPVAFPLPLDEASAVAQRYRVRGLPTTFVIDPRGRIVYSALGERVWDDPALLDQVRALARPGR